MTLDELCFATASRQAELVRTGAVSARELVAATLDRISSVDVELNSFRVVLADQAMASAQAIDDERTSTLRPLLGVPVAIKDDVDVAGVVTAMGTSARRLAAVDDSPIVTSLRRAGAVVVGKTNCSELVAWPFTETDAWGATRNPWNTDYSPGGSSGGSAAAVAAGLCGLALGSDGLGSIRVPASFCGIVGLKPQHGRVWTGAQDWNGLSTNGPLARSVHDTAAFLDATSIDLLPETFSAALTKPGRRLSVALAWKPPARWPLATRLGLEQRRVVEDTATMLHDLGHEVHEHEVGFPAVASNSYMVRYLTGIAETSDFVDDPAAVSARTRQIIRFGRRLERARSWADAAAQRFASTTQATFDRYDVVLSPGAVDRPLRIGELDGMCAIRALYLSGRRIPHFAPWNATGQPALSVPAGFSELGLPLSVQFAGRAGDESTLLQLGAEIEASRPWHERRPSCSTNHEGERATTLSSE